MALKLKKLGHTDLTIFEKSARLGGQSFDVNLNFNFFEPSYFDNLVALAREYNVGDYLPMPQPEMWLQNGTDISLHQYTIIELSKFTNSKDEQLNAAFLVKKLIKYIRFDLFSLLYLPNNSG